MYPLLPKGRGPAYKLFSNYTQCHTINNEQDWSFTVALDIARNARDSDAAIEVLKNFSQ